MKRNNPPTSSRAATGRRCLRLIVLSMASLALAGAVHAQSAKLSFDQPAEPLGKALATLARTAGVQVVFASALTEGKAAPALKGSYTAREALDALLAGSGLMLRVQDDKTFTVERVPAVASAPKREESTLPEIKVRAAAPTETAAGPITGYLAEATQALGIDLPLQQTPATVNIVSAELLKDLGARKLTDVMNYVPGVTNADNFGTPGDLVTVRGFSTGTYFNGMRQALTTQQARTLKNIERIEIVKGPAGFEAAISEPGGFVNLNTKKPQAEFALAGELGVGDYGFRTASVDVTGPLASVPQLQYRLIAAHDELVSWRPGREKRPQDLIAPSLQWAYAPGSRVLVEYERLKTNDPLDRGTLYIRGAGFKDNFAGRDWSVHQSGDSKPITSERVDINWTHRLNSHFSFTLRAQDYVQKAGEGLSFAGGQTEGSPLYDADRLTYSGTPDILLYPDIGGGSRADAKTVQATLRAEFDAGGVQHTVSASAGRNEGNDRFGYAGGGSGYPITINTINLFAPDNQQAPDITGYEFFGDYVRGSKLNSLSAQWVAKWTPQLRSVFSLRRDNYKSYAGEEPLDGSAPEFTRVEDKLTSARMAGSYDVTSATTVFAGYSNSFVPQGGVDRDMKAIDALRAQSFEMGSKTALFDGRALWTNTVYQITQDNVTACDPIDPDCKFLILFGKVRVRGFESELVGQVTPMLKLTAGLALQQATIVRNADGYTGNRFANTPRIQASAFGSYLWADFGLPQLTTRLGAYHVGDRPANSANEYQLPAYTRVDAGLSWAFSPKLSLDFNVENLADTTYYTAAQNSGRGADQVGVGNRRLMQVVMRARV